jgi:LacI family transcriptional regulator
VPQTVSQRLTIRQIADLAGVSIATVSRVLNGRDDVSDDTRELVSRVIRENGYTANRSARGLSAGRSGLVGVLVPLVYPAYFSGILAGAAEALSERDLQIVLSPTGGEHDREVSVLDRLHGLTDGALIILPEESSEELERLLDGGFRFVVLDPLMPLDERIPSVSAAHTSGADQAMRHLLDLGHRRIAQITGPRGWLATEDRRRGYRAALAAAGILPDRALEVEAAEPEIAPGREAAEYLLGLPEPPTAIFAFNDNIAIGAVQAARARGLRLPEDLSIVGFDDVEHATIVTPALTTVRQPLAEMGRTAVSLLMRLLERQRFETLHVELATRLVVRDSTAPPPA